MRLKLENKNRFCDCRIIGKLMSRCCTFCAVRKGGKAEETHRNRTKSRRTYEKAAIFAKDGDAAILQKYADAASECETRERRAVRRLFDILVSPNSSGFQG